MLTDPDWPDEVNRLAGLTKSRAPAKSLREQLAVRSMHPVEAVRHSSNLPAMLTPYYPPGHPQRTPRSGAGHGVTSHQHAASGPGSSGKYPCVVLNIQDKQEHFNKAF